MTDNKKRIKNIVINILRPILGIFISILFIIVGGITAISVLSLGVSISVHWGRLWWCVPILGYELWIFMDQTKEKTLKDTFIFCACGILNCIILMIFEKELFEFLVDSFVEDYYRYFK